jgi:hypothetical protein
MLAEHRTQLDQLAEALLARETLDEADAYAAAGIPKRTHPDVAPGVTGAEISYGLNRLSDLDGSRHPGATI